MNDGHEAIRCANENNAFQFGFAQCRRLIDQYEKFEQERTEEEEREQSNASERIDYDATRRDIATRRHKKHKN
jgi:hypothetical protein